jgi:beta-galactosidase
MITKRKITSFSLCLTLFSSVICQRTIINLNGTWDVEESVEADRIPGKFTHQVEVPGLTNQAKPQFPDVDRFYGKEYYSNQWTRPMLEKITADIDTMRIGYSLQKRNYFWYRKVFTIQEIKEIYILKINKAQFGTVVWINGKKAGGSFSCFASQLYDITQYVKAPGKNVITVRIGAHPGILPPFVPAGNDYEKRHWTPGIYDDIAVICSGYPFIESIQVAPDIHKSEVTVQTVIIPKTGVKKIMLNFLVKEWRTGKPVISQPLTTTVDNPEQMIIAHTIPITGAQLWSPENPFLYIIDVSTGSDQISARFGMRELRFETSTKRAYLNDKLIFLRGSNITLHRFFDDSLCRNHPWDEQWVRKLLTDLPKKYHWNSFRFCIGPVPDKWFDIADEAGLIIQNEYFIWSYRPYWDKELLTDHIKDWMCDNWNHPSVGWWDINNETHSEILTEIIGKVRSLDLSNRAWDNGYNLPQGDNDPVEDHNYKWYTSYGQTDCDSWNLQKFEEGTSQKTTNSPHPSAHACVLNEYGWLWLKRNGQVTLLTSPIYDSIAKGYSNSQRQELYAYLVAIETEYFRAHRNYAGVLHFDYLTGDFKGAITGDIFKNPETLEPVPVYDDYFSEIFKPLGVYVNFFPKEVLPSSSHNISVMLVNDEYHRINGNIEMQLYNSKGSHVHFTREPFSIGDLSQKTCILEFHFPSEPGDYLLETIAIQDNGEKTICRRKISIR